MSEQPKQDAPETPEPTPEPTEGDPVGGVGPNPFNLPRRQAPIHKAPGKHWIDKSPLNGGSGIGASDQG